MGVEPRSELCIFAVCTKRTFRTMCANVRPVAQSEVRTKCTHSTSFYKDVRVHCAHCALHPQSSLSGPQRAHAFPHVPALGLMVSLEGPQRGAVFDAAAGRSVGRRPEPR